MTLTPDPPDRALLTIVDDGDGFDVDAADVQPGGGIGLTAMRFRAQAIHGTLTFASDGGVSDGGVSDGRRPKRRRPRRLRLPPQRETAATNAPPDRPRSRPLAPRPSPLAPRPSTQRSAAHAGPVRFDTGTGGDDVGAVAVPPPRF